MVMETASTARRLGNLSVLTPAEQAVLDEALTGAPARDIAETLSLSEATVRSHLSSMYLKLGVSGRVALLAAFREENVGERPESREASPPRPPGLTAVAWGWMALGVLGGAYAIYVASWLLSHGGGQATWLGFLAVLGMTTLTLAVARRLKVHATRMDAWRSLALAVLYAAGSLAAAVSGWLPAPVAVVIVGAAALLGVSSFRAERWLRLAGAA